MHAGYVDTYEGHVAGRSRQLLHRFLPGQEPRPAQHGQTDQVAICECE